jgi:hypothetical protein
MRRGMNSLALQVQEGLKHDPHAGDLFVFRGRRGNLIKVLWHDALGMSLYAMAASGKLDGRNGDRWHMARQIGALLDEHPELRQHVYALLKDGTNTSGLALLAEAVSENPDANGLLLLLRLDAGQKGTRISWRTIQSVVTEHVPDENWKGAYSVVSVPAVELRQKLLALTTDGGPADAAARCLNEIDCVRDEYGMPEAEPRHPDLASGKPWPIMTPNPVASAD